MLKNLVLNFVRDERGAESAEVGVANVLLAGGAISGSKEFRNTIKAKQLQIADELDAVTSN